MNQGLKKALIGFFIPAAAVVLASMVNIWLGLAAFAIYIVILLYTSRVMLYTVIGSRNYSQGKTEEALKWFKRAYDSKKAGIRASVSYAYIMLKNTDTVGAEEILRKLIKDHPSSDDVPYVKSILALVLWKKGELDAATEMLQEVTQTYKTTSVYGSLGYMLILKGDLEKALQFNLEAYEYNSSDKIIRDNLGQNYYLLGMYDKSREIYEPLIAAAPTFPEPYFNYGLLLEKTGDPAAGLEMMKKALQYKFSYLSSISREDVESKIQETSASLKTVE